MAPPNFYLTRLHCCREIPGLPGEYCTQSAEVSCEECKLLGYCSEECRAADRQNHEAHCVVKLEKEKRKKNPPIKDKPSGATDDGFWAKHEATNVLCLEDAEGLQFPHILRILLLGNSSLRHFIYSVVQTGEDWATGEDWTTGEEPSYKSEFFINDTDPNHLVRTILGVLLLTHPTNNAVLVAEAFVHLWYSAKIPKKVMDMIRSIVEEPLREAYGVVKRFTEIRKIAEEMILPMYILGRTIPVWIHLRLAQWEQVLAFLAPSPGMTSKLAQCVRNVDLAKRPEMTDLMRAQMYEGRAACMDRWKADGILLPFGHSRAQFDTLNPVFFQDTLPYPQGASAEPLAEWRMQEVYSYERSAYHPEGVSIPENDIYRKMFFYVRDLCVAFQYRIRVMDVKVFLLSQTLSGLPRHLYNFNYYPRDPCFDRIEVGTFFDDSEFLTMLAMSQLLRPVSSNCFARMLTITRNSVAPPDKLSQTLDVVEDIKMFHKFTPKSVYDEWAPPLDPKAKMDCVARNRRRTALLFSRDWDGCSETYFSKLKSEVIFPMKTFAFHRAFLGLRLAKPQPITRRWANRVTFDLSETPTRRDFECWLSWPDPVPKRWIEWQRFDKLRFVKWIAWIHEAEKLDNAMKALSPKTPKPHLKRMRAAIIKGIGTDIVTKFERLREHREKIGMLQHPDTLMLERDAATAKSILSYLEATDPGVPAAGQLCQHGRLKPIRLESVNRNSSDEVRAGNRHQGTDQQPYETVETRGPIGAQKKDKTETNGNNASEKDTKEKKTNRKDANEKDANDKETNRKDANEKGANEKKTNGKDMNEKNADEKDANEKETNEKETNKKETNKKETNKKETNKKETNGKNVNEKDTSEKDMNEKHANEKETNEKETNGKDADEKDANKKKMNGKEVTEKEVDEEEVTEKEANEEVVIEKEAKEIEAKGIEVKGKKVKGKKAKKKEAKRKEVKRKESKGEEAKAIEVKGEEVKGEKLNREEVNGEEVNREEVDGEEVDREKLKGEELNGEDLNGDEVSGEEVNGEEVNGEEENGKEENRKEEKGEEKGEKKGEEMKGMEVKGKEAKEKEEKEREEKEKEEKEREAKEKEAKGKETIKFDLTGQFFLQEAKGKEPIRFDLKGQFEVPPLFWRFQKPDGGDISGGIEQTANDNGPEDMQCVDTQAPEEILKDKAIPDECNVSEGVEQTANDNGPEVMQCVDTQVPEAILKDKAIPDEDNESGGVGQTPIAKREINSEGIQCVGLQAPEQAPRDTAILGPEGDVAMPKELCQPRELRAVKRLRKGKGRIVEWKAEQAKEEEERKVFDQKLADACRALTFWGVCAIVYRQLYGTQ